MARQRPVEVHRSTSSTLPEHREPLIGREREVAFLAELVRRDDIALVTLTGAGGTGKTRLALAVASALVDEFPDGIHLVSLSPIRNPELIPSTIARAIGIEEAGDQPVLRNLHAYLRDKRLLLLLDNVEHLVSSAPLVTDLLTNSPGLIVLATSRVALRLTGEHVFPVSPLALPNLYALPAMEELARYPAVMLLLRRASAAAPDFTLNERNARDLAEICVRLDGLPLALELAAARLRILSPTALLARLSRGTAILTGGPRDLPDRQRTLRGTIDWSHDLLTLEQQRAFRSLSCFTGSFSLDAATAVIGGTGEAETEPSAAVLESVTSLVEQSLILPIETAGELRFTMLETIRQYAAERLAQSQEAEDVQARHARYFLDLIEAAEPGFFGGRQNAEEPGLEPDLDNLRTALQGAWEGGKTALALRLAAALAWYWYDHGYLSEGRHWLELVLAKDDRTDPAVTAKALIGIGALAHRQFNLTEAQSSLEQGLHLSREWSDVWHSILALINLGLVAHDQGDYARARHLHEESLQMSRAAGNDWGIGASLTNLAWAALFEEDFARARDVAEEALEFRRELNDTLGLAHTLYILGRIALEQREEPECRERLAKSVILFQQIGERWGIAACLETFAIADVSFGASRKRALLAARRWSAAERLREIIGAPLTPTDQSVHRRHQQVAREHIGEERWRHVWEESRAQPLKEPVA